MDKERYSRMVQFHDNFLDKEDLDFLRNYLLYECLHNYGEYSALDESSNESNKFYSTDFDFSNKFIISIFNKIMLRLNLQVNEVIRIHSNIQHCGMGGGYHYDDTKHTILLMVTGDNEVGFEFKKTETETEVVEFVPNRLIHFNGCEVQHRGLAPKTQNPRITLAFKFN